MRLWMLKGEIEDQTVLIISSQVEGRFKSSLFGASQMNMLRTYSIMKVVKWDIVSEVYWSFFRMDECIAATWADKLLTFLLQRLAEVVITWMFAIFFKDSGTLHNLTLLDLYQYGAFHMPNEVAFIENLYLVKGYWHLKISLLFEYLYELVECHHWVDLSIANVIVWRQLLKSSFLLLLMLQNCLTKYNEILMFTPCEQLCKEDYHKRQQKEPPRKYCIDVGDSCRNKKDHRQDCNHHLSFEL